MGCSRLRNKAWWNKRLLHLNQPLQRNGSARAPQGRRGHPDAVAAQARSILMMLEITTQASEASSNSRASLDR